jgi:anti-anti-sigma regulatory factor
VVSLAGVEDIGSGMLGKFITLHKRVEDLGGRLGLCCINSHLLKALDAARLTRHLRVYGDEQEAAREC